MIIFVISPNTVNTWALVLNTLNSPDHWAIKMFRILLKTRETKGRCFLLLFILYFLLADSFVLLCGFKPFCRYKNNYKNVCLRSYTPAFVIFSICWIVTKGSLKTPLYYIIIKMMCMYLVIKYLITFLQYGQCCCYTKKTQRNTLTD